MSFVKWIRKNNRKIMVFVVIFCMVSFVIGSFGIKILVSLFGGGNQMIATYDDGKKIKSQDFIRAQNELTVLRMLMADRLLLAQSSSGFTGPLLVHLLMPESQFAGEIASQMKQAVQQGQIQISMDQLDDFFSQRLERPEILWILLKEEAYRAGTIMPSESAAETLRYAIPQMTANQMDASMLVNQIITNNNITEQQILRILADLISVMAYAGNVMDNQAVTLNQIKASLGRSKERIDAEFVKIPAEWFIDEEADVTDVELQLQFEDYKAVPAGNPTPDNPFGFGYELDKRVQVEYMVVLMDDVKSLTTKPTAEDLESYYSNNIDRFRRQVPSDPNDPESEKITQTQSFAEVQAQVRRALEEEKTTTLANTIFNEIKTRTETGFETLNFDEASAANLQKAAGDYAATGSALSQKYNLPIAVGKTGWLNTAAFGQDKILSGLSLRHGQNYLRLTDLAFAATEDKSERQRIGMPSIRVWENIGPLNGGYYSQEESKFRRLMALVRVVGIRPSETPDDIMIEFDTRGVVLGDQPVEDSTFSVKEQVKDDILLVKAMQTAKERTETLAGMVNNTDWEEAINTYNETYAKTDPTADPNTVPDQSIELAEVKQQLRISQSEVQMAKRMMLQNPASAGYIQNRLITNMLTNQLYDLLDEGVESTGTIQAVMEVPAQASCYIVKEVVRQPATMKDYLDNKAQTALQLSMSDTAGLALTHLSPENIIKRVNLQYKEQTGPIVEEPDLGPEDIDI